MKLRKILLPLFAIPLLGLFSCNNDDDGGSTVQLRDRQEVYDEDIVEIEEFLSTHFYNYEEFDFDNPYSLPNDSFRIVFDTIDGDNLDKIPLIDQVQYKMVEDSEGIEYKLYYLAVREGQGNEVHFTDRIHILYEGSITPNDEVFQTISSTERLSMISYNGEGGIVQGLADAMVEFKTSDGYSENGDGTVTYHNFGIGAVFIPSGLGYFNQSSSGIPSYTPMIFKFELMERDVMDHDQDGIPSYLEDLDGDVNIYNDDTDEDAYPNFFDADDDGDLVLTIDEVEFPDPYVINVGDPDPEFAANEYEISREVVDTEITIKTVIFTDTNGDGTPDYLDPDTAIEN